jgi:rhodanese-related sulfurtransferase
MQTEVSALRYIRTDPTAVWVDARESSQFTTESIPGARNIPVSGLKPGKDQGGLKEAQDDGRLPMEDHNTRIVVFGANGKDAQAVADAISREAFHNVSFVAVPFEEIRHVLAST